jgi:AAA15 family ATPase/GTPase
MEEQDTLQSPRFITRHVNKLLLDPNNYRFIDKNDYKKVEDKDIADPQIQKRTMNFLLGKNRENIRDLIASFKENGFLPVDQIQVKELPDGNYLVLEGNRRVATLKYLYQEWRENGIDIGKLKESDFKRVPLVLHPGDSYKNHLIVMGLKHISGNKKWNPVNQAQLIEDLLQEQQMGEGEVCDSLGISTHAMRRSRRTHFLIKRYKKSDFGDQFESSMYSIFEEVIKSTAIKEWLDWDDNNFSPRNTLNEERFFSWISKLEEVEYNGEGEVEKREIHEPIITKYTEVREMSKYIHDKKALQEMEDRRSVTAGFVLSDAVGKRKFSSALDTIKDSVNIVFNFSEYMKNEDIKDIEYLRDKLDRLIPTSRARIITSAGSSAVVSGAVSGHFSEITVSRFRGLDNVKLKKLNRVNIFAGFNNSGKTSVLEAVYLLTKLNDINAFFEMEKYRGRFVEELNSKWIETNFLQPITIEAVFNGKNTRIFIQAENTKEEIDKSGYLITFVLTAGYNSGESVSKAHLYSNKDSSIFYEDRKILCNSIMTSPYRENDRGLKIAHAQAVKEKAIDIIVSFIRKNIDPAIKKIDMTTIDGVSRFFVTSDTFEKSIDITNYGEGVRRVFEIALFFAYARNGVLLIDEFETAIHKSLLVNFTRFVQELAERFNVQVFLTSHSKECIDSFIMNNYRTKDITAYLLKEEKGVISCKYVEGKRLEKLLESIDVDIREG